MIKDTVIAIMAVLVSPAPAFPRVAPVAITTALTTAAAELNRLEACKALSDRTFDQLDKRYSDLELAIEAIWGKFDPDLQRSGIAFDCSKGARFHEAVFEARMRVARAEFDRTIAPLQQGAWVGSIPLCRDTVAGVSASFDELTGTPSLKFRLVGRYRALFSELTARAIGGPIAVRLSGRVISQPMIQEPILKGEIALTGPSPDELRQLRFAIEGPC